MTFNTAVSGLRAANDDMGVISNNVANASTAGFKSSRAEFGDVYAAAAAGVGSTSVGGGVLLSNVSQQFSQGTIAFTDNSLDMAINGAGFFILDENGETSYTRAGYFGLDNSGRLVNSGGKAVQGNQANENGTLSGELSALTINSENLPPNPTSDVNFLVNLDARETTPAESGTIAVSAGAEIGVPQAANVNGYTAETLTFTFDDGSTQAVTTLDDATASEIVTQLNNITDISARAETEVTLSNLTNSSGNLTVSINGVLVGSGSYTMNDIAVAINNLTNTSLSGITASETGGVVTITSNRGDDVSVTINNTGNVADTIEVDGAAGAASNVLLGDGSGDGLVSTVGGALTITMGDGIGLTTSGAGAALFEAAIVPQAFINNAFDPTDQDTYNHASSVSIFDSQGNSHVLTTYFVKEAGINEWTAYVLVDGQDVGDPNEALAPPENTVARRARFDLIFNADGTLNGAASDPIQISYWNPIDEDGNINGALQGLPVAQGGEFPVPVPATSSNFAIDLTGTTQFGSAFSVNDVAQDGFTTGRLVGLEINQEGLIFSRFTNGQARALGQVALANFNNAQGLQPSGDTEWVESFDSGVPNPGVPGSASLGLIQAGAIEESNVELSQELVKMIVAQRNFQANARTIQTSDAITQAIINIR